MPTAKGSVHRTSRPSNQRRPTPKKNNFTVLIILGCVVILGLLGFAIYKLIGSGSSQLDPDKLEKYVNLSNPAPAQLNNAEAVYFDFSDGMNSAFASPEAKEVLQSLVNKLNGKNSSATFYSLANNNIAEISAGSDTELYNRIMNPDSYANNSAPIQAALEKIVSEKKPALLITDYEEYNNRQIQQAAYAKESFIQWLAGGYTIYFYEWDYVEGNKQKKLFVTVFDDSYKRLLSKVYDAIDPVEKSFVKTFVLGGRDFAFPEMIAREGANYHNENGKDVVTCVTKIVNYNKPQADAEGHPDSFAPLSNLFGPMAQYYPLGADWEGVKMNAKGRQDFHLFSKLYVNLNAQSGYEVKQVEARAFNVGETVDSIASTTKIVAPEIEKFVKASIVKIKDMPDWEEIIVDFDEVFNPEKLPANMASTDLIRINLQISEALPRIEEARKFFSWQGNNSLAASVINTLQASEVNPTGRLLFSYFLKAN